MFENDGTLGLLENSRIVVLRGSTYTQWFTGNVFPLADWIKTSLENRGFSVIAARVSRAGFIGDTYNVELELNVFNNYTAEEARVNAIRAIEDFRANFGTTRVFSNTTLSVVSDAYVPPGSSTTRTTTRTPAPTPSRTPSVYDQSNSGTGGSSGSGLDFWSAAGISTPIALVGGGLLLLLLLRR